MTEQQKIFDALTDREGLEKELTAEEAAKYLKALGIVDHVVHTETMRKWFREGRIQAHKVATRGHGGSWRTTVAALLAFDPKNKARWGRPPKET